MAELHSSIVAMISLAAGIASNHPAMGQCQLSRLRKAGISEEHINAAIEIARHIRDEAAQMLDQQFDELESTHDNKKIDQEEAISIAAAEGNNCCSSTASGQSCC